MYKIKDALQVNHCYHKPKLNTRKDTGLALPAMEIGGLGGFGGITHETKVAFLGILFLLSIVFILFDSKKILANTNQPPVFSAKVLNTIPHDARHFTQGYFFIENKLYESTGLKGESGLYHINQETGEIIKKLPVPEYFLEGGAETGGHIHLLTWKDGTRLIIEPNTLKIIAKRTLQGEGWGLCNADHDATKPLLWYSDGSATLRLMKLDQNHNWEQIQQITIYDPQTQTKIEQLNELEFINGYIFANIWKDDKIAIINPNSIQKNGLTPVSAWIDCQDIAQAQKEENKHNMYWDASSAVLNGIAWNKEKNSLLITGKLWNKSYEIALPELKD